MVEKLERLKELCDQHTYYIERIKSFQKGTWFILDENNYKEKATVGEIEAIVKYLNEEKDDIERQVQKLAFGGEINE